MTRVVAVYSALVGVLTLIVWGIFWVNGTIADMTTRPWEVAMHLTAEFVTAGLLIVSGIGLWFQARWATRINVFASGMLVYSLIESPGRYLQNNAMDFVVMFIVVFLITVLISPAFKLQQPTP